VHDARVGPRRSSRLSIPEDRRYVFPSGSLLGKGWGEIAEPRSGVGASMPASDRGQFRAASRIHIYGCTVYRTSVQTKVKTTLFLEATTWRRFQEEVFRHEGGRAASGAVEKLIRGQDPSRYADALATVFPRPDDGMPSLEEVERSRPKVRKEVSRLIREARDEREDRVSGLQRPRKTVSR